MEFVTESKIESLEQTAKIADSQANEFMTPTPPKEKGKPGRKPDSPEEKARKAQERAQAQKLKASGQKVSGPENPLKDQPQASQNTQPQGPTGKEIAKNFMPAIDAMAVNWVGDPRAKMTPSELDACAEGLGMMMDKYMPTVMNQYAAEATLLIAFGGYGLRIYKMKREIELEKARANQFQNPIKPVRENNYDRDTQGPKEIPENY